MLAFEKELLGFYVTGHPLSEYAEVLRRYELASSGKLAQLQDGQTTRIGGIISKLSENDQAGQADGDHDPGRPGWLGGNPGFPGSYAKHGRV